MKKSIRKVAYGFAFWMKKIDEFLPAVLYNSQS